MAFLEKKKTSGGIAEWTEIREEGEEGVQCFPFIRSLYLHNVAFHPGAVSLNTLRLLFLSLHPRNLVQELQEDATSWVSKAGKCQSKQKRRHPLMALMGLSASTFLLLWSSLKFNRVQNLSAFPNVLNHS